MLLRLAPGEQVLLSAAAAPLEWGLAGPENEQSASLQLCTVEVSSSGQALLAGYYNSSWPFLSVWLNAMTGQPIGAGCSHKHSHCSTSQIRLFSNAFLCRLALALHHVHYPSHELAPDRLLMHSPRTALHSDCQVPLACGFHPFLSCSMMQPCSCAPKSC